MSVVGFDMGYQSCFVAVARQGGIETVANEYSDRNTPVCVSFGEKNRLIGAAAKGQVISNSRNTCWGWKKFLGRRFDDPVVQREKAFVPYNVVRTDSGDVGFEVQYLGETVVFTPQQVTAMMLTKLKEISESNLHTKVVDCVLSVPCYFTDVERRALLDSTKMAGMNCLRLMNDTTATALAYGIYKQDLPEADAKPRNVVFVDLGHSDLQVAACAFNKGKLKVLATAAHPNLGGRDFDRLLTDHFVQNFIEKYKIDARTKIKAYLRLLQDSEKVKKLMSANTSPIPLNIECFMEDKDVTSSIKRDQMDSMAQRIYGEAETVLRSILELSGLKLDDVYAVEIIGGSTRVPAIKDVVRKVFAKEPSTTLNADEAVARGCALQCAILSPTFRVRDFSVTDCQPYPVTLAWLASIGDSESEMEVFSRFHAVPFSKMLTFYRQEPFKLEARYNKGGPSEHIGAFSIDKVKPQENGESSKVKVKVRVNIHGIFHVANASLVEKVDVPEEEEKKPEVEKMDVENGVKEPLDQGDGVKQNGDGSAKEDDAAKDGPKDGPQSQEPMETDQKGGEKATAEAQKATEDDVDVKAAEAKKKHKVKNVDLPVTELTPSMTADLIHKLFENECRMISQDKLEKERADAKNAVEEYVYDMRDKLCSSLEPYVAEEARNHLCLCLEDTENWLYEEGEDVKRSIYQDKLTELKKLGDPIVTRAREYQQRPEAFNLLATQLQQIDKVVEAYRTKDEKYEHLDTADMEKVAECVREKRDFFDHMSNKCNALSTFDDAPVMAAVINEHRQTLERTCHPIISKPKPKPKVEEPPKEEPKNDAPVPPENGPSDAPAPPEDAPAAEYPPEKPDTTTMDLD